MIDHFRAPGERTQEGVQFGNHFKRVIHIENGSMDETVDQRHDDRRMQTVPGHITHKDDLAAIVEAYDIVKISAEDAFPGVMQGISPRRVP